MKWDPPSLLSFSCSSHEQLPFPHVLAMEHCHTTGPNATANPPSPENPYLISWLSETIITVHRTD